MTAGLPPGPCAGGTALPASGAAPWYMTCSTCFIILNLPCEVNPLRRRPRAHEASRELKRNGGCDPHRVAKISYKSAAAADACAGDDCRESHRPDILMSHAYQFCNI